MGHFGPTWPIVLVAAGLTVGHNPDPMGSTAFLARSLAALFSVHFSGDMLYAASVFLANVVGTQQK